MTTDKNVEISLPISELNLLVECLLFSSSVNICANWNEKNYRQMITIAESIKNSLQDKLDLKNITFVEEQNFEDEWTKDLFKSFANDIKVYNIKDV